MNVRVHCKSTDIELIYDGGRSILVPWAEVSQVHTYKADAIFESVTYTVVQLTYGEDITLFEDMEGWEEFLSVLAARSGRAVDALRSAITNQPSGGEIIVLYEQVT
jgi:hypothetical protein